MDSVTEQVQVEERLAVNVVEKVDAEDGEGQKVSPGRGELNSDDGPLDPYNQVKYKNLPPESVVTPRPSPGTTFRERIKDAETYFEQHALRNEKNRAFRIFRNLRKYLGTGFLRCVQLCRTLAEVCKLIGKSGNCLGAIFCSFESICGALSCKSIATARKHVIKAVSAGLLLLVKVKGAVAGVHPGNRPFGYIPWVLVNQVLPPECEVYSREEALRILKVEKVKESVLAQSDQIQEKPVTIEQTWGGDIYSEEYSMSNADFAKIYFAKLKALGRIGSVKDAQVQAVQEYERLKALRAEQLAVPSEQTKLPQEVKDLIWEHNNETDSEKRKSIFEKLSLLKFAGLLPKGAV